MTDNEESSLPSSLRESNPGRHVMIEEMVFTSAPKGLQLGSSGFCTVASTPGMASNLARTLQNLSGYRHLFKPGSAEAANNPVVYSHLKTKIGGRKYNIVSRIADAGFDYSNRSNKLAHHFAIANTATLQFGPSTILRNENQFFCEWDQAPTKLSPRMIDGVASTPAVCKTWQSVTSDAGWAGDVIEAVRKKRTVYLIVAPTTPCLLLFDEVLALLPTKQQWDVTFSTFFTKIPSNIECAVRCIIQDSPEVAVAKRSPANLVLDLTSPLGASSSELAESARNGTLVDSPKISFSSSQNEVTLHEQEATEESGLTLEPKDAFQSPSLATPSALKKPPKIKGGAKPFELASSSRHTRPRSHFGKWLFVVALLLLVVGLAATLPFVLNPDLFDSQFKTTNSSASDESQKSNVHASKGEDDLNVSQKITKAIEDLETSVTQDNLKVLESILKENDSALLATTKEDAEALIGKIRDSDKSLRDAITQLEKKTTKTNLDALEVMRQENCDHAFGPTKQKANELIDATLAANKDLNAMLGKLTPPNNPDSLSALRKAQTDFHGKAIASILNAVGTKIEKTERANEELTKTRDAFEQHKTSENLKRLREAIKAHAASAFISAKKTATDLEKMASQANDELLAAVKNSRAQPNKLTLTKLAESVAIKDTHANRELIAKATNTLQDLRNRCIKIDDLKIVKRPRPLEHKPTTQRILILTNPERTIGFDIAAPDGSDFKLTLDTVGDDNKWSVRPVDQDDPLGHFRLENDEIRYIPNDLFFGGTEIYYQKLNSLTLTLKTTDGNKSLDLAKSYEPPLEEPISINIPVNSFKVKTKNQGRLSDYTFDHFVIPGNKKSKVEPLQIETYWKTDSSDQSTELTQIELPKYILTLSINDSGELHSRWLPFSNQRLPDPKPNTVKKQIVANLIAKLKKKKKELAAENANLFDKRNEKRITQLGQEIESATQLSNRLSEVSLALKKPDAPIVLQPKDKGKIFVFLSFGEGFQSKWSTDDIESYLNSRRSTNDNTKRPFSD